MPGRNSFFSNMDTLWHEDYSLRREYADAVPVPKGAYFRPIRSIEDAAQLAIRPIEKPLWLGFIGLGYCIKAILHLVITMALAPCALVLALVAPNSELRRETCSVFKLAAAQTVVATGMAALALFSAALALIFNPLFVATRVAATVVDGLNSVTESCCDLTIAQL